MGLLVHNLGNLPVDDGRDYYLYILDFGWKEPLTNTLVENFKPMARKASETNSLVLTGHEPIHFANEVFSYHGINGEEGEQVLPAILITSLHPKYFQDEENNREWHGGNTSIDDKLLLIPLKKVCETPSDVIDLINSIFLDIKNGKELSGFSVAKEVKRDGRRRMADAVILQPTFAGMGVDIKKLFNFE